MVREQQPDVVLIAYPLPGYSADRLIPRLHTAAPDTRVIVLSSDTSDGAMISALHAGAVGFMTKDKAIDDVLDALGTVSDGGTQLTPRQLELAGPALPATGPAAAARAPRPDPVELRLVGIGSFAP